MATKASKIDAAAEKAYAEAAAKTANAKAPADKKAKADTAKSVGVAAIAKKVKAEKKPARKTAAKKTAAKKVAKKAAPKKVTAKKAAPKRKAVAAKTTESTKETIMTKAQDKAADFTAQAKEGFAELQTRAKAAYDKSSEYASDMGEFTKGNVEAVVESGKILAAGMQDMAKSYVAEGKDAVETMTADVKDVAAVKSPTEFVQLQGKIASRNFDATVASVSKNTEAWVKLANDVFAPLSNRMSVAMEKVRKAA